MSCKSLGLSFGGLMALNKVSFDVREGEIMAIIGPNGSGKTSLLNCINGFYTPESGKIYFQKKKLNGVPPHKIAKMGIARTFQSPHLYPGLMVYENIMTGRHPFISENVFDVLLYFWRASREEVRHRNIVEKLIDFLEIESIRKVSAGILPFGLQKRVGLGRALALDPQLLLLDEPMSGMNVEEKEDMARFILDIKEEMGKTIIIVEHDMEVVMDISDRIVVLDYGEKIAAGLPHEILENPRVKEAYLGEE